jgi:Ca-activated chloride channel homolog
LGGLGGGGAVPGGFAPANPASKPKTVTEFAKENQAKPGDASGKRGLYEEDRFKREAEALAKGGADKDVNLRRVMDGINQARDQKAAFDEAKKQLDGKQYRNTQGGKLGVDLSVNNSNLRNQERMAACANVTCNGRQCIELGGVWIDEGYEPNMKCVTVKAQSDAYFRILEKNPKMKDVFRLGNHLVWVAPSKMALIVDTSDGKDKLTDTEIDELFTVKK